MYIGILDDCQLYNKRLYCSFLKKLYGVYGNKFIVSLFKVNALLKGLEADVNLQLKGFQLKKASSGQLQRVKTMSYENPYTKSIERHDVLEELVNTQGGVYSYEVRIDSGIVHLRILFFTYNLTTLMFTYAFEKYPEWAMIEYEPEHIGGNELTNRLIKCHPIIKSNLEHSHLEYRIIES